MIVLRARLLLIWDRAIIACYDARDTVRTIRAQRDASDPSVLHDITDGERAARTVTGRV
jgi:hypothetical protein